MAPDVDAPDPQGPPVTPAQALEIVRARYAQPKLPDGTPAELQVHEFDIGYLVYAVYPPRTDAAGPPQPAPPGGAKIVVSKETGETVTVPNYPTEQAIALYRKNRARNA
ncbi:hypothetical protein OG800_15105 [Streptomyces sp. NBC_00445]|uniref:hypothetical protein n=1 Tax=Streptomyces sp. NBC_00445 TaxID=2975745 RepID=UPI002E21D7E0